MDSARLSDLRVFVAKKTRVMKKYIRVYLSSFVVKKMMKFAYLGYDMMLPAMKRLAGEGHHCSHVFSFAVDGINMQNHQTQEWASALGIPFTEKLIDEGGITSAVEEGAQFFFSAGYPSKIPQIPEPAKGVNFHPTLLPEGRGIIPMPYLIYENPEAAGMTLHKLSDKFDQGDILAQHKFDLTPHEDIEMLMARLTLHAPEFISKAMADFDTLWAQATPQKPGSGSHYKNPGDEMRLLDFTKTVAELDRLKRAFGKIGTLMEYNDQILIILDFAVWKEAHDFTPGDIVGQLPNESIIAAKDGFVVIKNAVAAQTDE